MPEVIRYNRLTDREKETLKSYLEALVDDEPGYRPTRMQSIERFVTQIAQESFEYGLSEKQ